MKAAAVLGLVIAALLLWLATGGPPAGDNSLDMIKRNCARFYGSQGAAAERDCRTEMLRQHALLPSGTSTR